MGFIYYHLNNSASLREMVPPTLGNGSFGEAKLPAGMAGVSGVYIIINCQNGNSIPNRYVGISQDIGKRFTGRMAVVTELGFPASTMENIYAVWGSVGIQDGNPTVQIPNSVWTIAAPGSGAFQCQIDNQQINLEHLLARFVLQKLGSGTISNNQLMQPFHNNGSLPLRVIFHSKAFGNYPDYTDTYDLPSRGTC
jgi:hypothetical protein